MKVSLLAVVLPSIVECAKFGLDVSRHLGYGAPTFLNRRPNKICLRRVKKKSNSTSSSQKPKYDDASPKEKGPYNESPQTGGTPDSNTINETPKKHKNSYNDGKKRGFNFPSPAQRPSGCAANPKQMDMKLTKKPPAPEKSYDLHGLDVQYMLDMVNHARGKNPLRINDKLMSAAQKHADYLASMGKDFLDHTGQGGSQPCNRCNDQKYFPNTCGENIATGNSEEDVMDRWLKSCGHYNNIMDEKYAEFGVWRTGTKWVQVFGEGDSEFNPSLTTSCSVQGGDGSPPQKPSYDAGDSNPQMPTYGGGSSSPQMPTYGSGNTSPRIPTYGGGSSSPQMPSYGGNSIQGHSPTMYSFY
ncbi:hypothetical protein DSO57_1013319 [Entomophthora muscae]|uniref:Uncharacterized protein n=1 Tax=Entomophthora muscae TaxID=34485 RepID=A0ACC2UF77_9FUNG|nr:hypothetical protein DSO57_1013319 [Entomophthora muscae]